MRVDDVELRCCQQCRDGSLGSAASVGASEKRILSGDGMRSDGSFDDVGVDLDTTIGEEALQRRSPADDIADCLGELRLARQARQFAFPGFKEIHGR